MEIEGRKHFASLFQGTIMQQKFAKTHKLRK